MSGFKAPTQVSWSLGVLVIILAAGVAWLVAPRQHSEAAKARPLSVPQWLDECSPFESLDGTKLLDFSARDNSVKMTEAVDSEKAAGAASAKHPKIVRGTWSADESTKQIMVTFNATTSRYVLLTTFSEDRCILSAGDLSSADLRNSWFGEVDLEPEDAN